MNTNLINRAVKAITVVAVAAVVVLSTPLASLANGGNKKTDIVEKNVSVQYVGATDNNVIFHVEYENPTAEKFWLIIKNDAGDVVYRKQFSDAHFSKSVYFQQTGDFNPTFIISNGGNEVTRQFSINTTITENTVVTKL